MVLRLGRPPDRSFGFLRRAVGGGAPRYSGRAGLRRDRRAAAAYGDADLRSKCQKIYKMAKSKNHMPRPSAKSHAQRPKVRQKRRPRQNHVLKNGLFQPPLRRPGLRGNTHTLGPCTRTQRASVSSDTACTRPAHARRAAVAAARVRERLTVTLVSACRRCSSPAVGMSMPEARTRVTPFDT